MRDCGRWRFGVNNLRKCIRAARRVYRREVLQRARQPLRLRLLSNGTELRAFVGWSQICDGPRCQADLESVRYPSIHAPGGNILRPILDGSDELTNIHRVEA